MVRYLVKHKDNFTFTLRGKLIVVMQQILKTCSGNIFFNIHFNGGT